MRRFTREVSSKSSRGASSCATVVGSAWDSFAGQAGYVHSTCSLWRTVPCRMVSTHHSSPAQTTVAKQQILTQKYPSTKCVLRPNETKKARVHIGTYTLPSGGFVSECLPLVGSLTVSPPAMSLETHMFFCRCPLCACPVQGFQLLESRQVYEHILALEDEAAGLRAQLKRFSRRVSSAVVVYL